MTPTDTLYGQQWHFDQLGTLAAARLIERIWNDYTGVGIHVGVYDEGVQSSHTDLDNNYDATRQVIINGSTLSGNNVGNAGHGTSVAGLIAAENNGAGTVGVAFGATVTGVNIFDPASPIYVGSADITQFTNALHQMTNFDVVNHSWNSNLPNFYPDDNINNPGSFAALVLAQYAYASANGRGGLGTNIVQSAGNENVEANGVSINASRYTITVGALHQDGFTSSYSNHGSSLLVSASGGDFASVRGGLGIVTTDLIGTDGYNNRGAPSVASNYTNDFGGTSSAAPIVSGVVSLMLSANSNLGWRDVQNILALSADHTGSAIGAVTPGTEESNTWFVNGSRNWNGGGMHFSEDYGYGAVNAYAAARMAEVWSLFAPAQTSANEVTAVATGLGGFINDAAPGNVPTTTTFTFNVATNIQAEHIDLTLGLTHSYFTDLRIFLVSPQGTEVQIYDGSNGQSTTTSSLVNWTFGMENFHGENTAGLWTLKIVDAFSGDSGTLSSIGFNAFGSNTSINDTYHYTDEFALMKTTNGARATLADTKGGTDWIDAAAVTSNVILDMNAGSSLAGRYLDIAIGTIIENAVTGDGNDTIIGNAVANTIYGMRGNDTINGMDGADKIFGGKGNDTLTGGLGNDTFFFNVSELTVGQADMITDYTRDALGVGDMIALVGISAANVSVAKSGVNAVISYGNGTITDTITASAAGGNAVFVNGYSNLANAQANNHANGFTFVSDAMNQAAHIWSSYLDSYDANGIVDYRNMFNDDGTRIYTDYDNLTPGNAWSRIEYGYNLANQLATKNTFNDDSTRSLTTYDNAGQTWSNIVDAFNAGGAMTSKTTNFDDTSHQVQYFDTAANAWSSIVDQFNIGGLLYAETTNFDSGSRDVLYLDRTGQTWNTITDQFNTAGKLYAETTNYDNNTRQVLYLDVTNLAWTTILDQFNSAGNMYAETTNYDNNTREVIYLDQTNQIWSTILDQYNAAGNLYAETTKYDLGNRQVTYLDVSNQIWSSITDQYDAQNRLTSEATTLDSGNHTQTIFDITGIGPWKQDVTIYDPGYNVLQHYHLLYNGTIVYL